MTAVLALNVVLAIVVVAALLRLLSWAIISSHGDHQPVKIDVREPHARPYGPHPHWPEAHRAQPRSRAHVAD